MGNSKYIYVFCENLSVKILKYKSYVQENDGKNICLYIQIVQKKKKYLNTITMIIKKILLKLSFFCYIVDLEPLYTAVLCLV